MQFPFHLRPGAFVVFDGDGGATRAQLERWRDALPMSSGKMMFEPAPLLLVLADGVREASDQHAAIVLPTLQRRVPVAVAGGAVALAAAEGVPPAPDVVAALGRHVYGRRLPDLHVLLPGPSVALRELAAIAEQHPETTLAASGRPATTSLHVFDAMLRRDLYRTTPYERTP